MDTMAAPQQVAVPAIGSTWSHGKDFYGNVLLTPEVLADVATSEEIWNEILVFHHQLATDEYVAYLDRFYRESLKRYGRHWRYMDIVNSLYAASKVLKPRNYLEIGVRRGRSVCTVAMAHPDVDIVAFDLWQQNYAGMENPGPEFVQAELKRMHHRGQLYFVNGDSHQTIPEFFRQNPGLTFDMMTVDGDHSEQGAIDDLMNVIPHLSVGGVLVFDDIAHPKHEYLLKVWRDVTGRFPNMKSYEFGDLGYGVAFAIKTGA